MENKKIIIVGFGWASIGFLQHIDTKKYRARILGSGVAIIVFFSGLGLFGTYNNGFPERFPDYQHVDIPGNKNFWNRKTCFLSTNPDYNDWAGDECALTEGEEEVLFWGDSFAAHYTPGIKEHKDWATPVKFVKVEGKPHTYNMWNN